MRKPLERVNGKYKERLDFYDYAAQVAEHVCNAYPEVDIMDLDYNFCHVLSFAFMRKLAMEKKTNE